MIELKFSFDEATGLDCLLNILDSNNLPSNFTAEERLQILFKFGHSPAIQKVHKKLKYHLDKIG